jgi:lipopolysaccharide export system protein LptA
MRLRLPGFTIERLRTLVLVVGVVLVAGIVGFLALGKWKRNLLTKDLPHRLGIDIQQQADGFNYTQSRKGKTLFKIHASHIEQMKKDGKTLLHDVTIDLYGEDGNRTDTISGREFEYDQKAGVAQAAGAVEITVMRPSVTPAVAQLKPGKAAPGANQTAGPKGSSDPKGVAGDGGREKLPAIAGQIGQQVGDSEIHVKTSGLTFNQKTQVATTEQRVDFTLKQGSGTSIGAVYSSGQGQIILDHAVELHVQRNGGPVTIHATHADFERKQQSCQMTQARAEYTGGTAEIANALLHFRDDGSVSQLDGSGGVDLKTDAGSHLTAPRGTLNFDEKNRPQHGLLEGGTRLESTQPNRQIQGTAPTERLDFDGEGQLRKAHLEQGVFFTSEQQTTNAKGVPVELHRTWKSQTADLTFEHAAAASRTEGKGAARINSADGSPRTGDKVEPTLIRGEGGVVVTSETTGTTGAGGNPGPARLAADTVVATFAAGSVLSTLDGQGHASFDQHTAEGVHQSSASDQLEVHFLDPKTAPQPALSTAKASSKSLGAGGSEIESVVQTGHVVLVQDGAKAAPGKTQPDRNGQGKNGQQPLRATAGRLDYDGASQMMHLTGAAGTPPRVQNGPIDLSATRIDFARASGDAFAHGDVKASWISGGEAGKVQAGTGSSAIPGNTFLGGGSGSQSNPVHAVAAEAELRQASGEVVFRAAPGGTARLWQAGNSVTAPTILLNRQKQTLDAQSSVAANPVRTVLITNPPSSAGKTGTTKSSGRPKQAGPSVMRVRSGDLHYSEGEREAIFRGGSAGSVTLETTQPDGASTVVSDQAEVFLTPAGTKNGVATTDTASTGSGGSGQGNAGAQGNASIDHMIAHGHVTVDWPGRKGFGEQLVYLGEERTFTLTGTGSMPPRMTDQVRGNVTGSALIFNSRDDSVTVEGDGGKTVTETHAPKKGS